MTFRIETKVDASKHTLTMHVTPSESTLWVAYFAPFTYQDHQSLIASVQHAHGLQGEPMATVSTVAQSLDGRDVELITLGNGPAKVWMIARQHPGESMAEHYMQGRQGLGHNTCSQHLFTTPVYTTCCRNNIIL